METESAPGKIEAIYQLREAVEAKAQAEHELERNSSAAARDVLLAAQIEVEARTQDAIDVCHECDESHPVTDAHAPRGLVRAIHDNVVHVNFRSATESA